MTKWKFICLLSFFIFYIGLIQASSTKPQQKQRRILLIFMCIPVSPGRSRVIWVFLRNFNDRVEQLFPRWMNHVVMNLILDSDLYLLHVEVICHLVSCLSSFCLMLLNHLGKICKLQMLYRCKASLLVHALHSCMLGADALVLAVLNSS